MGGPARKRHGSVAIITSLLTRPTIKYVNRQVGNLMMRLACLQKDFVGDFCPIQNSEDNAAYFIGGKPCFQYPIGAQYEQTYDQFMSALTDEIKRRYPSMTDKEINEIGFHADFHIGSYHMVCPMKLKPVTLDKCGVVLNGSEANK